MIFPDRRRAVIAFLTGGLLTMALLAVCLIVVPRTGADPCRACKGSGFRVEEEFVDRCAVCEGTGSPDSFRIVLRRNEEQIADTADTTAFFFWVGAGLTVFCLLVGGLRAAECPLCRGTGRLAVDVRPPRRRMYRADVFCDVCEGKGAVTDIDRWIAGL